MGKKKVKATLSFDADVYRNFQRYCNENAIMLSKKIEIFMDEVLKAKRKKIMLLMLVFMFIMLGSFASAATISVDNFECGGFSCGSGWGGAWSFSGDCIVTSLGTPIESFHMRGQEDATRT